MNADGASFHANSAHAPAGPCDLPPTDYAAVLRQGMWLLTFGFGAFLAWAFLAPLDEAVPASGVVSVESSRKRIDHLQGGLVEKILVKEGQKVLEGEALLVLNKTQGQAALNTTRTQWLTAMATLARLHAERDHAPRPVFPAELMKAQREPEVAALLRAQQTMFRSRRDALQGELRILRESARGLETQLASLDRLKSGRSTQIALFNEQLQSLRDLRKEGFVSRNHLLELERQLAEVQAKQSEDLSSIAAIEARRAEFRMRINQREMEDRREIESQIAEVQREFAALGERVLAQQDAFERLVLRAPVAGTVMDLAAHTTGGVVKPGEALMYIVPEADALVVEARVAPQYIDRLHAGLPADVRFDSYASRSERPLVQGQVAVVSADASTDERSGTSYYAVRVDVPAHEARKLGGVRLQPGMQATVMVKTGERSLMAYLARPILRRFESALSEH